METTAILLHGALGTARQFNALLPFFQKEKTVFALDFPGHGGLPAIEKFSLDVFSKAVLNFMDEKSIERAEVFGYSMGGYIGLNLAWKHPERIEKLTTLNTKLAWNAETAARMQGMMNPEKIEAKAPQLAENLALLHGSSDWKSVARKTSAFLAELGAGLGLPESAFSEIGCPVLVLRGENDSVVSAEESLWAVSKLKNGVYREVLNSGHLLEQVDFGELAKAF